jgi:hypothetical protein
MRPTTPPPRRDPGCTERIPGRSLILGAPKQEGRLEVPYSLDVHRRDHLGFGTVSRTTSTWRYGIEDAGRTLAARPWRACGARCGAGCGCDRIPPNGTLTCRVPCLPCSAVRSLLQRNPKLQRAGCCLLTVIARDGTLYVYRLQPRVVTTETRVASEQWRPRAEPGWQAIPDRPTRCATHHAGLEVERLCRRRRVGCLSMLPRKNVRDLALRAPSARIRAGRATGGASHVPASAVRLLSIAVNGRVRPDHDPVSEQPKSKDWSWAVPVAGRGTLVRFDPRRELHLAVRPATADQMPCVRSSIRSRARTWGEVTRHRRPSAPTKTAGAPGPRLPRGCCS